MTTFDVDGLPQATNHAGWNVQCFGVDGWFSMHTAAGPFEDKGDAKILLAHYKEKHPREEFRIYEALT